jgi:uncharacterized lipoprotein YddW (UPF0748 family)
MIKMKNLTISVLLFLVIYSASIFSQEFPKRELRGVWIATVANIDWPSSPAETSGEQIRELVEIFDKLKAAGINAVYFQVRTECDALYRSSYEPWSYWLTGKQGKSPDPYYDPLSFAVNEAHARGMEIHAWMNPYRAVKDTSAYPVSENHITKTHPEWILQFGNYKMLNPGIPRVTEYICNIVTDIIKRYNVDGVHLDDYFYPYSPQITTEDSASFRKYKGNFTNIDDWRRNNINTMIASVYKAIYKLNPNLKFGVSPFGVVDNKYAGTKGFSSYNTIYCDPLTWIQQKTVDYVAPQLYWEIGNKFSDFKKLLPWWASVANGRDLYIGLFSSKMAAPDWKGDHSELYNEIRMARKYKNVNGLIFFSAKSITQNYSGLADSLKSSIFKYPAFVPVMKWKNPVQPPAPANLAVKGNDSSRILSWSKPVINMNTKLNYVIYRFEDKSKIDLDDPKNILSIVHNDSSYIDKDVLQNVNKLVYVVTSADNQQIESINYSIGSIVLKRKQ